MQEKIMELNQIAQRYDENILSKVDIKSFNKFIKWTNNSFSQVSKNKFLEFYELANGFEFNGLIIYSLDHLSDKNIYDLNEEWHNNDEFKRFIFFGDSDITWYCYDNISQKFCELDKPSGTIMESYDCFSDMVLVALNTIV